MKGNIALDAVQNFLLGPRTKPDSPPPFLLAFRSSTVFINCTICLAIFTDILFYGLVVPVLPFSLTVQVGVPEDQVQQWNAILLACYNVTLFVGAPLVGWYADNTTSRRLPLLLGLLALAGSTLLLCLGKTVTLLVIGRLLQGLSAAIVWSVGLALLADTMGRKIGAALGYVAIAMSTGLLIAPVIGGAVYNAAGYYAVYYVAFAIIFCDIVLRLVLIEKKVARHWTGDEHESELASGPNQAPDMEGTAPTATLPSSSEQSDEKPENSNIAQSPNNGDGQAERTTCQSAPRNPNLVLLTSHRILAALFGCIILGGAMFAFDTVLPLFVKNTFNWDSTAAGLIFITVMVPGFFSPLVGLVSDRYGAKWPALAGFVASIPLFVCLRFVTEDTLGHKVLLCVLLTLLGVTMGVSTTPLMAEITYAIDDKEREQPGIWGEKGVYGVAYGLFTTSFALGGTVGSIMSGEIVATAGWGTVTWVLAVWYVAAIPVIWLWLGGKPSKQGVPDTEQGVPDTEQGVPDTEQGVPDTEQGVRANGPASPEE